MISAEAIRNCANYVVDSPNGRIGRVTQIRYDVENGLKPAALVVRAGRSGTRLLVIPITELAAIRTARRRVVVHRSPLIKQHPAGGPIDEPRWDMRNLLMRLLRVLMGKDGKAST